MCVCVCVYLCVCVCGCRRVHVYSVCLCMCVRSGSISSCCGRGSRQSTWRPPTAASTCSTTAWWWRGTRPTSWCATRADITHTHTHAHTQTPSLTHAHAHALAHKRTHTNAHTHTHTQTHSHAHAHTRTHTMCCGQCSRARAQVTQFQQTGAVVETDTAVSVAFGAVPSARWLIVSLAPSDDLTDVLKFTVDATVVSVLVTIFVAFLGSMAVVYYPLR